MKQHYDTRNGTGHIHGVEASSARLIRATLTAAAAAGAILIFFWLPAEYGIDPTRVGRVLGLTEMGKIKQQLYAEASAEDAALATAREMAPGSAFANDPAVVDRLDAIEKQLVAIAAVVGAQRSTSLPLAEPAVEPAPEVAAAPPIEPAAPVWRDEVSYALAPGQGVEVKLVMKEGVVAEFEWTANGSVLNYDTHGDGGGNSVSYQQGRGVADQAGTLTAPFTGNHGWFWRNRTDKAVTVTLRVRGDYDEFRAP